MIVGFQNDISFIIFLILLLLLNIPEGTHFCWSELSWAAAWSVMFSVWWVLVKRDKVIWRMFLLTESAGQTRKGCSLNLKSYFCQSALNAEMSALPQRWNFFFILFVISTKDSWMLRHNQTGDQKENQCLPLWKQLESGFVTSFHKTVSEH